MVSQKMGLILLSLVLMIGCGDSKIKKVAIEGKEIPQFSVNNFRMDSMQGETKKYTILARTIRQYESRDIVEADSLTVWFFDEEGDTTSLLISDYGEYSKDIENLMLIGNIKVTSFEKEGTYLLTDSLYYNKETALISSDSDVEIYQENNILRGQGFKSTTSLSRLEIYKIKGTGSIDSEREF